MNGPDPYKLLQSLCIAEDDDDLVKNLKRSLTREAEWYFMGDNSTNDPTKKIVEPVKITITRLAFDKLKLEDENRLCLLAEIKKKAFRVEWEEGSDPQGFNRSRTPQAVVWWFEPQVYLQVVEDYPWLLDKDLGCKETIEFGNPGAYYTWTP